MRSAQVNASKLIASLREKDTFKNAAGERTLIAQLVGLDAQVHEGRWAEVA
jgi:hypothetical protein